MAQAKNAGDNINASDFHDESTGGAGKIPVTKPDGKIDNSFLSNSLPYNIALTYAEDDLVYYNRALYASNIDDNTGNLPTTVGGDITDGVQYDILIANGGSAPSKSFGYGFEFSPDGTKLYALEWDNVTLNRSYVVRYNLGTAWDITTAVYHSEYVLNEYGAAATCGLLFADDGSKFWVLYSGNETIYEYSMSTAWDITTSTYVTTRINVGTYEDSPQDMIFGDSGNKLYICGTTDDNIIQYNLSSAYDLSSIANPPSAEKNGLGNMNYICFNTDGTRILWTNTSTLKISELTTAWDISTMDSTPLLEITAPISGLDKLKFKNGSNTELYMADNTGALFHMTLTGDLEFSSLQQVDFIDVNGQEASVQGVALSADGTKMHIVGTSADTVFGYTLSTAFDTSTATYTGEQISVSAQTSAPYGIEWNDDGTKFFVIGNNSIFEYSCSTAYDVSTGSYSGNSHLLTGEMGGTIWNFHFADGGERLYVSSTDYDLHQYSLSTAYDITTVSYDSKEKAIPSICGLAINSDGTKALVYLTSQELEIWEFGTAYDVTTLEFIKGNGDISPIVNTYGRIHMHPDGDEFYTADNSLNDIHRIALGSVFDFTVAAPEYQMFDVGSQEATPSGLFFKPDGKKMYIAGYSGDEINEYDLGVAWDLRTVKFLQNKTGMGNAYTVTFSNDGTKMYVNNSSTINQYTLSTAWDVSTATADGVTLTTQYGCYFSENGKRLWTGYNNSIITEFRLSTAWDISTATSVKTKDITSDITALSIRNVQFTPSGTTMLVTDQNGHTHQYRANTAFDIDDMFYDEIFFDGSTSYQPYLNPATNKFFEIDLPSDEVRRYDIMNPLNGYWTKISL